MILTARRLRRGRGLITYKINKQSIRGATKESAPDVSQSCRCRLTAGVNGSDRAAERSTLSGVGVTNGLEDFTSSFMAMKILYYCWSTI